MDENVGKSVNTKEGSRRDIIRSRAILIIVVLLLIAPVVLIPLIPSSGLTYGVDISDVGFSLNQYRFFFSDIDSIYLPLYLTDLIGAVLMQGMELLGIPVYLGFGLLWVVSCWYLCFLSVHIFYEKLRLESYLGMFFPLVIALLFAKCNFHFFIYNTTVAVMAGSGLAFLLASLRKKKPVYLSFAALFFVLATLCKISAMVQFGVFLVLFYDLYHRRDWRYFWKQVGFCVLGTAVGVLFALALFSVTCGVGNYVQMVLDMFVYAGSSNDGHTLANMIAINVRGVLSGMLIVFPIAVVGGVLKRLRDRELSGRINKAIFTGIAIVLALRRILGDWRNQLYQFIGSYYNVLAVFVALVFLCTLAAALDRRLSYEARISLLSAGLLVMLMPIGSNVGISHICNEAFFAVPVVVIYLWNAWIISIKREKAEEDMGVDAAGETTGGEKKSDYDGFCISAFSLWLIWTLVIAGNQSLYLTRAYRAANPEAIKPFSIEELSGMRYDETTVDCLEGVVAYLREQDAETMVVSGSAPLLHCLSGIRPLITGCGGWIETDYVSAEEIEEQLADTESAPVVVFRWSEGTFDNWTAKTDVVYAFVEENDYRKVYENEQYVVYMR